jgi:hypothetical protein
MKRLIFALVVTILAFNTLSGQDTPRKWALNGSLHNLSNVWIPPETSQWQTMTSIVNRLDFRWYPTDWMTMHIGGRNIMNYGQMVQQGYPLLAEFTAFEQGYLNLTKLWVSDTSFFFYSEIDRANIQFTHKNFEAQIGRQRINWGINMVWTPNDIFNTFDYFDFDYIERPGCDAVSLQYYLGAASSLQFAFKMDHQNDITSALMYRFNKANYDYQVFAGVMEDDYVAGAGWAGDIKGAGFTGEATYFIDRERFADTNGVLVGTLSLNYTFKNSIYLNGSYLFNSAGTKGKAGYCTGLSFVLVDISAKNFTRAMHSIFGQISYPVTPLIKADLSSIFNPNDKSGYFGPSFDFSLTDNISLLLIGQIFWGEECAEFGDYGSLLYFRLKWSF